MYLSDFTYFDYMEYDKDTKTYIYPCPHCGLYIQVRENEVNCKIFRHAIYKKNYKQVNPHAKKELCDRLAAKGLVYGCAKPYEMYRKDGNWCVRKCEYK